MNGTHIKSLRRILTANDDGFAGARFNRADLLRALRGPPRVIAVGKNHEHRGGAVLQDHFLCASDRFHMASHSRTLRIPHHDKYATPAKFLKFRPKLPGTVGPLSTWSKMNRQHTFDQDDDEREQLRRLKDELFTQPPLESFGEPQVRWAVARVIERALMDPQPIRRTAR